MKAEKIFGFASCALGLLPLITPTRAQNIGPPACTGVSAQFNAGTGTIPIVVAPNSGSKLMICGYSMTATGVNTSTAYSTLLYGFGSTCVTSGSITSTTVSVSAVPGSGVSRSGLALTLPQGASLCAFGNGNITAFWIEVNYSLN